LQRDEQIKARRHARHVYIFMIGMEASPDEAESVQRITVLGVKGNQVREGINAPKSVAFTKKRYTKESSASSRDLAGQVGPPAQPSEGTNSLKPAFRCAPSAAARAPTNQKGAGLELCGRQTGLMATRIALREYPEPGSRSG
jgi:hypothetical protein